MHRLAALLLVLACACSAQAGLFDDDQARTQINTLRSQLDDASRRIDSVTHNQVEFSNQNESVKADIAKLRGQIDELTYNLDAAQKRQKDFYLDLDNRLRKIESQGQAQESTAEAAKTAETAAIRDYEAALDALKHSDCKAAVRGFESFIAAAPSSPQQPSAHFFAGYCYGNLKQAGKAIERYDHLLQNWPNDDHAPDAMLGRADSLDALGKRKEARAQLVTLAAKFPASDAGKQAKARLKKK